MSSTGARPRTNCTPWLRYDGNSMSSGGSAMVAPTDTASSPRELT